MTVEGATVVVLDVVDDDVRVLVGLEEVVDVVML